MCPEQERQIQNPEPAAEQHSPRDCLHEELE